MYITAQGNCRLRNDLYCVEWDVKLYHTIPYAYIGPKTRTEMPRKTKIGTEVAHVTRDSDTTFKVKRSKVNLLGAGHIVAASRTAIGKEINNRTVRTALQCPSVQYGQGELLQERVVTRSCSRHFELSTRRPTTSVHSALLYCSPVPHVFVHWQQTRQPVSSWVVSAIVTAGA